MLRPQSAAFAVLLAGLAAMAPISTDIALPAYAATATALGTTQATVAINLSLFMMGYAVGPLVYGPLSERFGRRPVLISGLALYVLAAIVCAMTSSIGGLLTARLVQGIAASSASVLVFAIVRDLFEGVEARKKLSLVMIILGLMPLIGPTVGAVVLAAFGWRSVYAAMAVAGLLLLVGVIFGVAETIRSRNPDALAPRQLLAGYTEVASHPAAMGYSLVGALCFGVLFAFIAGSPMLFMEVMGISPTTYGYLFAVPIFGMILGPMLAGRLTSRGINDYRIMAAGFAVILVAVAGLGIVTSVAKPAAAPVLALLLLCNFGIGLILPNASHRALQPMPHLAGFASAVLNSTQMLTGAVISGLVAALMGVFGGSAMAFCMAICAVLAVTVFAALGVGERRRRERAPA